MESNQPALWTETECWTEVARLANERGLRLEVSRDPNHPANPFLRLAKKSQNQRKEFP